MAAKLLDIRNLTVRFKTRTGVMRAVDGLNLSVEPGESLGLVGESGCGKSVTAMSILDLLPPLTSHVLADRIQFDENDLLRIDEEGLRRIRGRDIAMIFQEPMTSLNPVLTIGRQVAEPLMVHKGLSRSAAWREAEEWLDHVRIPAAASRMKDYPHQLSGGMRQRVMIAMAMSCRPKLLIADEPTTALDVTIQAQILSLMEMLKNELGMSLVLITHDLGVVAQMVSRVVVMYAGQVVEDAGVLEIFDHPFHPYTRGLMKSMPRLKDRVTGKGRKLHEIPGIVPHNPETIRGCLFARRCPHRFELCDRERPMLSPIGTGHWARCWLEEYPDRRKGDF